MANAPEAKKDEAANSGKKSQLMLYGFAVINLICVGVGAALVFMSTLGYKPSVYTEEQAEAELSSYSEQLDQSPLVYSMEALTVNLEGAPQRSLRVEINFQMTERPTFQEIMEPDLKAKARDEIIQILGAKNFNQIESVQGKLFLKNEIIHKVSSLLKSGVVKDIYFSDFVVQ